MGGGGSTQTVQKADPWSGLQPYLSQAYQAASDWFNNPNMPSYYPGATIAGQSTQTQQAQNLGTSRALNGSPLIGQANQNLMDTIQGRYMNANPYLDNMFTSAADPVVSQFRNAVAPALASQFSAAGRSGSGAQQGAFGQATDSLGRSLAALSSQIYGSNYENERQRQQAAMQFAPQLANQDWLNLQNLAAIGQSRDQYNQSVLNSNIDRFNFGQNLPLQKLNAFNSIINGGVGASLGTKTGSISTSQNPFTAALGALGMAGGVMNTFPNTISGIGSDIGSLFGMGNGVMDAGLFDLGAMSGGIGIDEALPTAMAAFL